jgi:hypothetical protein
MNDDSCSVEVTGGPGCCRGPSRDSISERGARIHVSRQSVHNSYVQSCEATFWTVVNRVQSGERTSVCDAVG